MEKIVMVVGWATVIGLQRRRYRLALQAIILGL